MLGVLLSYSLVLLAGVSGLVNQDIFLMSKCPDAARAMPDLAAVYYDNRPYLNMKFSYIGTPSNSSRYGVACPHDDSACFGNIQQLCVQEKTSPEETLQFILCQQRVSEQIGTYVLFMQCLPASPKWTQIVRCALGPEGRQLLLASTAFSEHSGAKISLTFSLNGSKRCVYDSGHWIASEEMCPGGASVSKFSRSIRGLAEEQHHQRIPYV
ncbi:hypothetical protein GQ54DRAFT_325213 [Martensiomyces pterosporus]|nr:hypothetical protein GQ54DRAFT_325213 [Martensiomyces pterosporus]